jgi:glycosyltransferase involved in cell wall biosynthesis
MAMGKAVVVSATAGLEGVIEDGETGVTVPPGDSGRMREAIARLLQLPAERARLGANARQAALERFGLDAYGSSLAAQLEEVAVHVANVSPGASLHL